MNAASLQAIATSVAQERATEAVLQCIVGELAAHPNVALTRIWLLSPRDRCQTCPSPDADPLLAPRRQCRFAARRKEKIGLVEARRPLPARAA